MPDARLLSYLQGPLQYTARPEPIELVYLRTTNLIPCLIISCYDIVAVEVTRNFRISKLTCASAMRIQPGYESTVEVSFLLSSLYSSRTANL